MCGDSINPSIAFTPMRLVVVLLLENTYPDLIGLPLQSDSLCLKILVPCIRPPKTLPRPPASGVFRGCLGVSSFIFNLKLFPCIYFFNLFLRRKNLRKEFVEFFNRIQEGFFSILKQNKSSSTEMASIIILDKIVDKKSYLILFTKFPLVPLNEVVEFQY